MKMVFQNFANKQRLNRLIIVIVIVTLFLLIVPKNFIPRLLSKQPCDIIWENLADVKDYMMRLQKRLTKLEDTVKKLNAPPKLSNLNNSREENSKMLHDYGVNSFWLNNDKFEDDMDALKNLFANKSKNHTTCLVTQTECKQHLKLIILITTHISHFERRDTIRNTWGNDPATVSNPRWKTVFLVGRSNDREYLRKLLFEIKKYDDIILGDVQEDFYQLTLKIQMGFEWAIRYCSFKYLLKGDDDVFINLPKLFNFLDDPDVAHEGLYAGNVQYQAVVFRSGRYGVAKSEFNKKVYPRYCSGGGFVMTRDVVLRMLPLFSDTPALKIDDAYVGVIALKAGIDVIHNEYFRMFEKEKDCKYNSKFIIHHPVKSRDCMEKLFGASLK